MDTRRAPPSVSMIVPVVLALVRKDHDVGDVVGGRAEPVR
jgi:hypothetical protein